MVNIFNLLGGNGYRRPGTIDWTGDFAGVPGFIHSRGRPFNLTSQTLSTHLPAPLWDEWIPLTSVTLGHPYIMFLPNLFYFLKKTLHATSSQMT